MKNFTRILALVAAMVAVSCTTDVTEDLGVQLGNNNAGQTEITLSLEESRTQLGEKAGNLYPLYWSEGDKISVNGVESSEAVISGENGAVASFSVAANTPYCIAYPAAAEGQVLFAEKQMHAGNGTFASGVATMYAYSENGLGVGLNHLTGVLKFGVTGSAVITKAQISTIDRKPIAGAFDFDFEKGIATPTKDSKVVIEYSFGEGVQLSEVPTYLHVVVPAGVYNKLYVTLYDVDGGTMFTTIKTDEEKPLSVGKVREFSNTLEYTPETGIFVIKDQATLKAWAEQAAESTGEAVLVADVDMTGEAWTSVEGFAGIFRGNGYAIKGLNAPLFGTTNAVLIEGVHLEDVDIELTNMPDAGAIVCKIAPTSGSTIKNCSASGKLVLNYDGSITTTSYVAGIIGRTSSSDDISGLVNKVNIEAKGTYSAVCMAGVVGYAEKAKLANCTNLGTITFTGKSTATFYAGGVARICSNMDNCVNGSKDDATGDTAKIVINGTHEAAVVCAGIVENMKCPKESVLTNNHNYANIYYQSASSTDYIQLCGLVRFNGNNNTYWDNCSNHGDIIATGATDVSFILGGFSTRHYQTVFYQNCHNYGDIIVKAEANTPMISAGGFMGTNDDTGETCYIRGCSNNGAIKVYTASASKVYLGGFDGKLEAGQLLIGVQDNPEMKSVNNGDILYEAQNEKATVYIGGVSGIVYDNLTGNATAVTTATRVAYFTNNGDITVNGACGTLNIGGITGRFAKGTGGGTSCYYALIDSTNNGDLTVNATVKSGTCAIGGLLGFQIHTFSSAGGIWVNNGKLTFTGEVVGDRLLVGGFVGATDKAFSGKNNTIYNFGDISCTGKVNTAKNNRIGGIYGQTNKSLANCHVFFNMDAVGYSHVGMITGCERTSKVVASNCSVGGMMITEWDLEDAEPRPIGETMTETNFMDYIYGGTTDWRGVENYNGCTCLSAKPTL